MSNGVYLIDNNRMICGHCKWAGDRDSGWQCDNPESSLFGCSVSYLDDGCELYKPYKQSQKWKSVPRELLEKVQAYIDAEWIAPYVSEEAFYDAAKETKTYAPKKLFSRIGSGAAERDAYQIPVEEAGTMPYADRSASQVANKLEDIIGPLGQTFQEKLLAIIDAKGLKDSEVYSKANIDRRLFSKIRSNKNYKPSKPTALAFAIALGLNLDETTDLLQRAGLALSPSSKADLIVKYCILNKIYDIIDVNAILYEYDQQLLGY